MEFLELVAEEPTTFVGFLGSVAARMVGLKSVARNVTEGYSWPLAVVGWVTQIAAPISNELIESGAADHMGCAIYPLFLGEIALKAGCVFLVGPLAIPAINAVEDLIIDGTLLHDNVTAS